MSKLQEHHKNLVNGKGKCSVPMWVYPGVDAGFCDEAAFGPQEANQKRYGNWENGSWYPSHCSGLACYWHGGPKETESCKP